jgi:hypothetical protein
VRLDLSEILSFLFLFHSYEIDLEILYSKEWEQKYPKFKIFTLTRVGSDHCPLLLDDGTKIDQFKRGFRLEPA